MTDKLYYSDSHIFEFTAKVLACRERSGSYALCLDRTAFFPEGGGQSADTGYIGSVRVLDVQEEDGEILHLTDEPVTPGAELKCAIDKEQRLRRMQNHSGEHIFSGLTHRLYGLNNVGFHMGAECMTIDFDGELDAQQLTRIETLANEAVRDNIPVETWFPSPEELETLDYRSKIELTGDVRIVRIGDIDCCACCAPHVKRSGEIGIIKLMDAQRHRGGVRIELACGMDALELFRRRQESVQAVSAMLSAKRDEVAPALSRIMGEQERLKERIGALSMELARVKAESFPVTEGNICHFEQSLEGPPLRELANLLAERCTGFAAVFSGSDKAGYEYIMVSRHVDLRAAAKSINSGINGRGGGKSALISGRASATEEEIRNFVQNCTF